MNVKQHSRKEQPVSSDVLVIPEGLRYLSGAQNIMRHGNAGIVHKVLDTTDYGTEFFTNTPCLIHVIRGSETFFDSEGVGTIINPGQTLLIPRHHHMVSTFQVQRGPLEAWLFFFSDAIIADFLRSSGPQPMQSTASKTAKFDGAPRLQAYVSALGEVYRGVAVPPELVRAKLLEILVLLHLHDERKQLPSFLINENSARARRNIKHVMRAHALSDLTIADFATLSGRSVSTFQRDFKRVYDVSPGAWLRSVRLEKGFDLVMNSSTTITSIAHELGYSDTSHFIRSFRARYGETPKQLRRHMGQKSDHPT